MSPAYSSRTSEPESKASELSRAVTAVLDSRCSLAAKARQILRLAESASPEALDETLCPLLFQRLGVLARHDSSICNAAGASPGMDALSAMTTALARDDRLSPQGLCNIAWGIAQLNFRNEQLISTIGGRAAVAASRFKPHEISMTALAYSVLGTNHPVLFKALASSARGSLRSFEPLDLADTARAFAGLQIKDHLLFEGLASESAGKMSRFKPKDLAHTAWSFAALNLMEEPLFRVISSEARLRLSSFAPPDLARIALAFATLNIQDEDFTRVIASEAGRRASRFSSQDCARIAWSLAVLDPSAAQVYLRKVESRLPSLDLDSLEFLQFHQALVACGLRMPRTLPPQARLQPSLCQSAQTRATGSFQDSVHNSLLEIKARNPESFGHIHTGLIFDGIQTDIVAEVAGMSWVINCDDHILHIAGSRRSGTAIGADVIQDLILARRGYRVLHILDTTWNESTHPSKWLEAQLIRDGRPQLNR